jgi:Chalcone isomerase-like
MGHAAARTFERVTAHIPSLKHHGIGRTLVCRDDPPMGRRPTLVVLCQDTPSGVDVVIVAWRRITLLFALLMALGAGDAAAKACLKINFPDQTQVDGSTLTLNGLGVRKATLLKIDVYVAALYVVTPSSDPNAILGSKAPIKLILHFVRDVGAGDISNGFDEGFAKSAKAQLPALQERIATLEAWISDLTAGQQMTFISRPGTGVQVDVNGTVKGTIKGDDFAKAFLAIWLGNPPNPEIKAGLLGGACA